MEKNEARESINHIRSKLTETREEVHKVAVHSVDHFLVWGIVVLIGMGLNILLSHLELYIWIGVAWFALMVAGAFISYRVDKKIYEKTGITTFIGKMIGKVWIAFFLSIVVLILIMYLVPDFPSEYLPSIIATLVGIGMFLTGSLSSWRLVTFLSVLWWIGAVFMAFFTEVSYYLYAILIFFTYIVPAIIMKITEKD